MNNKKRKATGSNMKLPLLLHIYASARSVASTYCNILHEFVQYFVFVTDCFKKKKLFLSECSLVRVGNNCGCIFGCIFGFGLSYDSKNIKLLCVLSHGLSILIS